MQEAGDPTIPAYTYETINSSGVSHRVEMTYYQSTTMRNNAYSGNGTGAGQMPVHTLASEHNSLYRYGFEIHQPSSGVSDGTISYSAYSGNGTQSDPYIQGWENLITSINTNPWTNGNPCTRLGNRWRLPNIKELAIMRNLGIFNSIGDNDFFLSCSMGVITENGIKITNPTDQRTKNGQDYNPNSSPSNGNMHYYMSSLRDQITQAMGSSYYVRCVRDYIP